jgi:hypothetical protein
MFHQQVLHLVSFLPADLLIGVGDANQHEGEGVQELGRSTVESAQFVNHGPDRGRRLVLETGGVTGIHRVRHPHPPHIESTQIEDVLFQARGV